jgi:hypothetical protein
MILTPCARIFKPSLTVFKSISISFIASSLAWVHSLNMDIHLSSHVPE